MRNLRSCIMRNQVGNSSTTELSTLNLAQLVLCFFGGNTVNGETTLGVVDETEVFASLFDTNHIHETSWESWISADLAINLDEALHDNGLGLTTVKRILE